MPRKTAEEQIGVELPDDGPDPFAEQEQPQPDEQPSPEQPQPDEEQPPEADRPDWLPDQYKKPEDLAAAHRSLQNELRLRAEREKQLIEQMGQMSQALREPQQPASADPLAGIAEALQEARDNGDAYREAQIQQYLIQQTMQQSLANYQQQTASQFQPQADQQNEMMAMLAYNEMGRKYEDWSDIEDRVGQTLATDPFFQGQQVNSVQEGVNLLERAYQFTKYHDLVAQQGELRQAGLQQADLDRARKQQAQTLSGATGRADQPSEADKELAAMQAALRGSSYAAARNAS